MNLIKYLQAQGIGSRKTCRQLAQTGKVRINGAEADGEVTPETVQSLCIGGRDYAVLPLPYFYILLNKPADYEVSHQPRDHPSVFALLPENVRAAGVQAVGRLDADTTGVLLLTNDGAFNHRLTSPKHHVAKIYRVTLKHPAAADLCGSLKNGVRLHDETAPVCAAGAELLDTHTLRLTLTEGKYHQVKRMVAAAGNRVTALHREQFGNWHTGRLLSGQWRFIHPQDC